MNINDDLPTGDDRSVKPEKDKKQTKHLYVFTEVCTVKGVAFMIAKSKKQAIKKIVKKAGKSGIGKSDLPNQNEDFEITFVYHISEQNKKKFKRSLKSAFVHKLPLKNGYGGATDGDLNHLTKV